MAKVTRRLVPFLMLAYFIALPRSRECRLRGRDDAGQPRSLGRSLRGRGRNLLHRLFFLRSAEQLGARPFRRAGMDHAHHVHLGAGLGRPGLRGRGNQLQYRAPVAGRRRGGLLPRHHLLPDAVVPVALPRPHRRPVHVRDPDLDRDRCADLWPRPQPRGRGGPARLAVGVPDRGLPGAPDGGRDLPLPDGQAARCRLARTRRGTLAPRPARCRACRTRIAQPAHLASGDGRSPRHRARLRLHGAEHPAIRPELLPAADRESLRWPVELRGRRRHGPSPTRSAPSA